MTPTARTLKECRDNGWFAEVVEKWLPLPHKRGKSYVVKKDLFGFIDIVALTPHCIVGIQATSRSNVAARIKKIHEQHEAELQAWLNAGGSVEVWGWGKMAKKDAQGRFWQVSKRVIT